jgi:hypothetical protein
MFSPGSPGCRFVSMHAPQRSKIPAAVATFGIVVVVVEGGVLGNGD